MPSVGGLPPNSVFHGESNTQRALAAKAVFPVDSFQSGGGPSVSLVGDAFSSNRFGVAGGFGDSVSADGNSTELVIGVNELPHANASIVEAVERFGGKVVNTVSTKDEIVAVVADVPLDTFPSFREEVYRNGLARYLEPNAKFQALFWPNDPYWLQQWGPRKIEADYAWNTTTGSSSVLVAVVDTGIDYSHPDLAPNYVPLGYNWVNRGLPNYSNDPLDDAGHGTHCAGIIAAALNNNLGMAGIAKVHIMAEKALNAEGEGFEDWLANGIIHAADQNAKIISMSWGGYVDSQVIHDAVKYAYNHGALLIAAAGNSNWNVKAYPASYDEVVAVAATDQNDNKAEFSNYGDWIEMSAPGVEIYSTMPTYYVYLNDLGYSMNYASLSGTSMACPHVVGVAALVLSRFPNASRDWVRAQLRVTSDDLGDAGFDNYHGYGRVNARKAVGQAPPNHDLLIFNYEKPEHIQPGDNVRFSVTVLNFGVMDEENVTVQLLVDGNPTDSTLISRFAADTSVKVTFLWVPLVEGEYNVTLYVPPVSGEIADEYNTLTKMICVRIPVGCILFDQTRSLPLGLFRVWEENLTSRGYVVDAFAGGLVTPEVLVHCDIFVIPMASIPYSADEILAIQDFVLAGGGLLVVHSRHGTALTGFAGISWGATDHSWSGYSTDMCLHHLTEGVSSAYFGYPEHQLFVSSPAMGIIRDNIGQRQVALAVSEIGAGRVIALCDVNTIDDYWINYADNLRLANNMIDWLLGVKHEHELFVSLESPSHLELNKSTILKATVHNQGLNDETNVELQLLINDSLVGDITVPELVNESSYTLSYLWTAPGVVAVYNVTVYVPSVPNENVTLNNVRSKLVKVHYPLIEPVEGQYANYMNYYYDVSGHLTWKQFWNFTYQNYVAPYEINVTWCYDDPYGDVFKTYMVVDIMDRYVDSGVWFSSWYLMWIETSLDVGSTVNLWDGSYRVNASRLFNNAIDCWEIPFSYYGDQYIPLYDKASGLMISCEFILPKSVFPYDRALIELADTNIIELAPGSLANPPVANFTCFPMPAIANSTVTFDASSSIAISGNITSYAWDFGDGNIATTSNPVVTHIYALRGTYNVTLTVRNSVSLTDSTWMSVDVLRHDLAVVDVAPYQSWVYEGWSTCVNVTVLNMGGFTETGIVNLYFNITAGNQIGTETISLSPDEGQTITFVWNTTGIEPGLNYTITANTTIPFDNNMSNNKLESSMKINVRIMGDINHDNKVGIADISLAARAFGSRHGDPRWNPDADINQDQKIDLKDIALVAKQFGKWA